MEEIMAAAGLKAGDWEDGLFPAHYLRRRGAEPTLVCLHGLGDSSLTFPEFVSTPPLRAHAVVAPDMPGFGRTPRYEPAAWGLRGTAQAVLALLDGLDVGAFVIVGHSLGGAVGVHLAQLAPFRCMGMISFEGNLTLADCSFSAEAMAAHGEGRYPAWRKDLPVRLDQEGNAGEPGKLRYLESFPLSDPETFLDVSRALVEESTDSGLGRVYAALDVPRLYLHGERTSPEETRVFLRNHALSERLLPDTGHWVHWDARDDAAAVCGEWLSAL